MVADDVIVQGSLCAGGGACTDGEGFGFDTLELKTNFPRIKFFDTSAAGLGPTVDWLVETGILGQENFAIINSDAATTPFRIDDGAPTHSFYIADDGNIGLGTSLPQAPLQIETTDGTGLRINRTNTFAGPPQGFELYVDNFADFGVRDNVAGSRPFGIKRGVPDISLDLTPMGLILNRGQIAKFHLRYSSGNSVDALFIEGDNGFVGLGTSTPEEKLHIVTSEADTDAFALFDAAGMGSDAAFRLRQQGSVPATWKFRNQESSGRLNVGIAGGNTPFKIDDLANNNLLRLGLNGAPNVVSVAGELRVNNTVLNVPDYVFADGYALRPLAKIATLRARVTAL